MAVKEDASPPMHDILPRYVPVYAPGLGPTPLVAFVHTRVGQRPLTLPASLGRRAICLLGLRHQVRMS